MRVFTPAVFKADFASPTAMAEFVQRFKDWKTFSDSCGFLLFGKDVSTKISQGHDFDKLMHVHLLPDKEPGTSQWVSAMRSKTANQRCNRQSDNLLFYAVYKGNFLLLRRSDHALMGGSSKLEPLCDIADRRVASLNSK